MDPTVFCLSIISVHVGSFPEQPPVHPENEYPGVVLAFKIIFCPEKNPL